jgi:hypothetical protein
VLRSFLLTSVEQREKANPSHLNLWPGRRPRNEPVPICLNCVTSSRFAPNELSQLDLGHTIKRTPWLLVRKRTIPTGRCRCGQRRFCGQMMLRSQRNGSESRQSRFSTPNNLVAPGIELGISGSVFSNSDYKTTKAVGSYLCSWNSSPQHATISTNHC